MHLSSGLLNMLGHCFCKIVYLEILLTIYYTQLQESMIFLRDRVLLLTVKIRIIWNIWVYLQL